MRELGLVARMPKISVIQAAGANPLVRSLNKNHGAVLEPMEAHTRATAIRIGNPASWRKAARVIQESGGWCLDVTEAEIAIAKAEIGRGRAGLRAGFSGDFGRIEEAARAGRRSARARL